MKKAVALIVALMPTIAAAETLNTRSASDATDAATASVYRITVLLGAPLNGDITTAQLFKQDAAGNFDAVQTFNLCTLTTGDADMRSDIKWDLCNSGQYQVEIDLPGGDQSGYTAVLTSGYELGYTFACSVIPPQGFVEPAGLGTSLDCEQTGRLQPMRPAPVMGVGN